jgi:hypothetical protein
MSYGDKTKDRRLAPAFFPMLRTSIEQGVDVVL